MNEHDLKPHVNQILEGIDGFRREALERMKETRWTNQHKLELSRFVHELTSLELELRSRFL